MAKIVLVKANENLKQQGVTTSCKTLAESFMNDGYKVMYIVDGETKEVKNKIASNISENVDVKYFPEVKPGGYINMYSEDFISDISGYDIIIIDCGRGNENEEKIRKLRGDLDTISEVFIENRRCEFPRRVLFYNDDIVFQCSEYILKKELESLKSSREANLSFKKMKKLGFPKVIFV